MVGYRILLMGLILCIIIIIMGIIIIIMGIIIIIMDIMGITVTRDIITKVLIHFLRITNIINIIIMEDIIAHINIMDIMEEGIMVIMAIDIKLSYSFVLFTFCL
jgi:hypothetical protein